MLSPPQSEFCLGLLSSSAQSLILGSLAVRFQQRIHKWFSRFLQTHASTEKDSHNASGPTILIVSHGAFLSTLFSILISSAVSFTLAEGVDRSRSCRNTSIMKVKCWEERGEWKGEVLSWGHVPHLVEEGKVVSVADDLSKAE